MIGHEVRAAASAETFARILEPWHLTYYKALPLGPLTEYDHNLIALLDENGRVLLCTHLNQLSNVQAMAHTCARTFGQLRPGDIVLANDPYAGALHLQDHYLIAPVYVRDQFKGLVIVCMHVPDIGGECFGNYHPEATELWQEGVLTTPVRLARGGVVDQDVLSTLKLNSRVPFLLGAAVETTCSILGRLLEDLPAQYDPASAQELIDQSRRAIARLRGKITGPSDVQEGRVHNCTGEDATIRLQVRPSNDGFVVDFTGSSPEVSAGFINSTAHTTTSAVAHAFVQLAGCRPNSGVLEALEVVLPKASIVDCSFPHAVGWSPHGTAVQIRQLLKIAMSSWVVLPEHRRYVPHRPVVHVDGCKSAECWV